MGTNSAVLRKRIANLLAQGRSQNELSKLIGISSSALSQWMAGKYKGNNRDLEAKVKKWLDSQAAGKHYRHTHVLLEDPAYQQTPTGKRVWDALEMSQMLKCLVLVYGAAGSGKTVTCEKYREERPNVWMFTPTKATSSVGALLMLMCDKLAISSPGSNNYSRQRAILRKLKGSDGLVVIDEAQQLHQGALDFLRQLQDEAKIGMVWCGNEPLYTQMTGGRRAPAFAQIFSRIAHKIHIERTLAGDVDPVAAVMGVTDRPALRYLRQVGVLPGGLRGVVKTVQLASMAAAGSGGELDREMIARAWRKLTDAHDSE